MVDIQNSSCCWLSARSSTRAVYGHTYMTSLWGLGFQHCSRVLRENVPEANVPSGRKQKLLILLKSQPLYRILPPDSVGSVVTGQPRLSGKISSLLHRESGK